MRFYEDDTTDAFRFIFVMLLAEFFMDLRLKSCHDTRKPRADFYEKKMEQKRIISN